MPSIKQLLYTSSVPAAIYTLFLTFITVLWDSTTVLMGEDEQSVEWAGEARAGPRRLASVRTKSGTLITVNHLISYYLHPSRKEMKTQ